MGRYYTVLHCAWRSIYYRKKSGGYVDVLAEVHGRFSVDEANRNSGRHHGDCKHGGRIEMVLRLPSNRMGRCEPLIESGVQSAADCLFIKYSSAGSAQLGFDRWGSGSSLSEEFAVDYAKPMILTVDYGAFFRCPDPRSQRLRVLVNGVAVLDKDTPFYPTSDKEVYFARNLLQMSTSDATFTGSVLYITALP